MSVAYTRISLLSASRVSSSYTERKGCISALIHGHVQFVELTFADCFNYPCVACQALRHLFIHYPQTMFPVQFKYN